MIHEKLVIPDSDPGSNPQDILLLGSQSSSRKMLLTEAEIPFVTVAHRSSELESIFSGDLAAYVVDIARHKMASLVLPRAQDSVKENIFVLTADSMVQHPPSGEFFSKPENHADAMRMLALARESEMLIMTGCCLREYVVVDGGWEMKRERVWATPTYIEFVVPKDEVDYFLRKAPAAMQSAGAGILEGFGANYLKLIRGSFSGGRGLPIFELRVALRELGFVFE